MFWKWRSTVRTLRVRESAMPALSSPSAASSTTDSSVGVKLCLIAAAARDLYMNPAGRCKLWDTAAPEIILSEAGGQLTDMRGSALRYSDRELGHHNGLVASNSHLHREALRVLEPFLVGRG